MPQFSQKLTAMAGRRNKSIPKGYWAGGQSGSSSYKNEIDGIDFQTETALNPSATLSVSRGGLAAVNSNSHAYFGGGYNGSDKNTIDGLIFETEAANNPSATLATARRLLAATSAKTQLKGYWAGGGFYSSQIDGINMATEAAINPSASLSPAQGYLSATQNLTKGYYSHGFTGSVYTKAMEGFIFSSETSDGSSGSLDINKQGTSAITSFRKSFWCGGGPTLIGAGTDAIEGFIYATETYSVFSGALSVAVDRTHSGLSAEFKGYIAGGGAGTTDIEGVEFNTETSDAISTTLATGRFQLCGAQPWTQY